MLDLDFADFNSSSEEGMLLLAAMSILTSDIDRKKFGGHVHPHDAFEHIKDLANIIFFEEEYKQIELQNKRNKMIEDIISNGANH
jgi:hypothetical protein